MDDTRQATIRRTQDTLIIAGDGVIAFGAWSWVKVALILMFVDADKAMLLFNADGAPLPVLYFAMGAGLLIDFGARAYVGQSARQEGRGKKKGPFYLFVAVLAAASNAASALTILFGTSPAISGFDLAVSFIVEMTAFAMLAIVVYSSVRLRHLSNTTE